MLAFAFVPDHMSVHVLDPRSTCMHASIAPQFAPHGIDKRWYSLDVHWAVAQTNIIGCCTEQ